MKTLGLSAFYHDSAAALVEDGVILAAAQEERFTRRKNDPSFPHHAIRYCLAEAQCQLKDIELIAFYDKPFLKFERLIETYLAFAPKGFHSFRRAMPVWLKNKLFQKSLLSRELKEIGEVKGMAERLLFTEHHQAHAASAFYPSPFDEAMVLTLDGVGEWATASLSHGQGHNLTLLKEIHFPHSLGLLYSAFTYFLGFKVNSGEYKVMGLAPYGDPTVYTDRILQNLIDLKPDGSFRLDLSYFDYCTGLTMTNAKFEQWLGVRRRQAEGPLLREHFDLAAAIQRVCEEVMLRMTRAIAREYAPKNLCLAGGVALNCVANARIRKENLFEGIWIQPAAGDAGGAVGAALAAYHYYLQNPRREAISGGGDGMCGAYLGPAFTSDEIQAELHRMGARFTVLDQSELVERTARALNAGQAIGWFQGRMEFGPRALGNRSILADARAPQTQKTLNLKIKYRESFRPFAPAVLAENVSQWFDFAGSSPYMLLLADVTSDKKKSIPSEANDLIGLDQLRIERSQIPAVTHVDYSARLQTIHKETNPLFHQLVSRFNALTGCPVVVNTSFNIRGEPIVCTPEQAYRCFMGTELDILAIGPCWLEKKSQPTLIDTAHRDRFALD